GGVVTAITSAIAASAAVSTATQKLNRASALPVAVRSTWFGMRLERCTFNQPLPRHVVVDRTAAMVGSPSAPVVRVGRAVDHRAGRDERDDQPEDAARDNVHNATDYGGDDHAYGNGPEELTKGQTEPSAGCTAGGLAHASPPFRRPAGSAQAAGAAIVAGPADIHQGRSSHTRRRQRPPRRVVPSRSSLAMSGCPACRAVSSIMCNTTQRTFGGSNPPGPCLPSGGAESGV